MRCQQKTSRNCSRIMDKKLKTEYKIITSISQWQEFASCFTETDWVGLDTEFMRDRSYYPQLCLVQLSCSQGEICLDPMAFDCAQILTAVLTDENIVKIIHSASQDIEVLGYYCESSIKNVYDTQLAAEFCNLVPQMGYATLVNELLKIDLPKSETRSNWAKRPLTKQQIEYSLNDVRYLKALYDSLNEKLEQNQKLQWFKQEQAFDLKRMQQFHVDANNAYKSFKSSHRLPSKNQQVVKQLLIWREQTAQQTNQPRNWVLADKSITKVGTILPMDINTLQSLLMDDVRFKKRYLGEVLACVEAGLKQPNEPVWFSQEQLPESQKQQVRELRLKLEQKAVEYQIPATRLATRKEVVSYVRNKTGKLTHGWRQEILNTLK